MNYNQKVEEAVSGNNYLKCGINENVRVMKVEYVKTDSYEAGDVYLNGGGEDFRWRIFPFNAYKGDGASSVEDQEKRYLQTIKHVFSKTVGTEAYDATVSNPKINSFELFIKALSYMSVEVAKDKSKPFRLILIAKNGKGDNASKQYTSMPNWSGGFCESMDVNPTKLTFDESKYGMKKKDTSKVENASDSPFDNDGDVPDFLKAIQ